MYYDKFDIITAHYLFYTINNGGDGCPLWHRKTGMFNRYLYWQKDLIQSEADNSNQVKIFNHLAKKHSCKSYQVSVGQVQF